MNVKYPSMVRLALFLGAAVIPQASLAQGDMQGASDHPGVPRISDSYIVGYAFSDFDEGFFIDRLVERPNDKTDVMEIRETGKRTRIVYVVPSRYSNLAIRKNYEEAFSELGQLTEHFECRNETCPGNLGDAFVWPEPRRIPVTGNPKHFYSSTKYYQNQSYWHATVSANNANYRVSVYSAARPSNKWQGQHFVHLEIVESDTFESTLEFVDASEMSAQIETGGRVALYGIQFDFDSTSLKQSSNDTLAEIARALSESPDLALYVVGHTDNEGALDYNRDLSERRAQAVVNRLVAIYGIEEGRLTPAGVGPVSPVATNETEEGKALNRRVELVRR